MEWAKCLALAAGPDNNRRYAGLLLASRLLREPALPAGGEDGSEDSDAVQLTGARASQLMLAVGADFLARLLRKGVADEDLEYGRVAIGVVVAAGDACLALTDRQREHVQMPFERRDFGGLVGLFCAWGLVAAGRKEFLDRDFESVSRALHHYVALGHSAGLARLGSVDALPKFLMKCFEALAADALPVTDRSNDHLQQLFTLSVRLLQDALLLPFIQMTDDQKNIAKTHGLAIAKITAPLLSASCSPAVRPVSNDLCIPLMLQLLLCAQHTNQPDVADRWVAGLRTSIWLSVKDGVVTHSSRTALFPLMIVAIDIHGKRLFRGGAGQGWRLAELIVRLVEAELRPAFHMLFVSEKTSANLELRKCLEITSNCLLVILAIMQIFQAEEDDCHLSDAEESAEAGCLFAISSVIVAVLELAEMDGHARRSSHGQDTYTEPHLSSIQVLSKEALEQFASLELPVHEIRLRAALKRL